MLFSGGPLLVRNGVKTANKIAKNKWVTLRFFHPYKWSHGAGDGVFLVVFEVSGETEGAESKAVGPTGGSEHSKGAKISCRAFWMWKLAKFETWDTYILERKYLKICNKNMLRAIFTWKLILDLNYCNWLDVLSSHFPFLVLQISILKSRVQLWNRIIRCIGRFIKQFFHRLTW